MSMKMAQFIGNGLTIFRSNTRYRTWALGLLAHFSEFPDLLKNLIAYTLFSYSCTDGCKFINSFPAKNKRFFYFDSVLLAIQAQNNRNTNIPIDQRTTKIWLNSSWKFKIFAIVCTAGLLQGVGGNAIFQFVDRSCSKIDSQSIGVLTINKQYHNNLDAHLKQWAPKLVVVHATLSIVEVK